MRQSYLYVFVISAQHEARQRRRNIRVYYIFRESRAVQKTRRVVSGRFLSLSLFRNIEA